MELIELGDGSSVPISTQILWYNKFYFWFLFQLSWAIKDNFYFRYNLVSFCEWIDTIKLHWREIIIDTIELKSVYLWQIENFHQARANKRHKRELYVRIKEMHTHMRESELKKEKEELK
jgi:hypothetical protein